MIKKRSGVRHFVSSLRGASTSKTAYGTNRILTLKCLAEWSNPEIRSRNAEIAKLKRENDELQGKLKLISEKVNEMVNKAKITIFAKETKRLSLVDELEWLRRNTLTFEKEIRLLKAKLGMNTNGNRIIELVGKVAPVSYTHLTLPTICSV
eukprot:TRINITY_DN11047_c0_g1_i1.p1 TRINITY_DN11047_c0_g1~~TRINITY_DN11047_c0_g1_i1.p1  ORF type:complete len:151 (+),score=15.85 TRINITY_DN11047_c0_g1_i1:139-591(+)